MQETSEKYKKMLAKGAGVETRVSIGDSGVLIDGSGDSITIGGVRLLVDDGGPNGGYDESMVCAVTTSGQVFGGSGGPTAGSTEAGEIEVDMFAPAGNIPRQARMAPFVRLVDGEEHSEWLPQGVYYLDTREDREPDGLRRLHLQGFDGMLRAEQDYPSSKLDWPAKDTDVVKEIATAMNVQVDPRVWDVMDGEYLIPYPTEYSCREVLGHIGAMYAGNWVMNETGDLLLVPLGGLPPETRYLVDDTRSAILIGGDRILV